MASNNQLYMVGDHGRAIPYDVNGHVHDIQSRARVKVLRDILKYKMRKRYRSECRWIQRQSINENEIIRGE